MVANEGKKENKWATKVEEWGDTEGGEEPGVGFKNTEAELR